MSKPIQLCLGFGDGPCPEYTVNFGNHGEVEAVVAKVKPEKDKPIGIKTDTAMGYVTTDDFVEDVYIPDEYRSDTSSDESEGFVPDGVGLSVEELFDADYCHFCDSVLDHHHHVTYEPETVIPVCQPCHGRLHTESGFRPDLSCTTPRPDNYESDFKTLFKQYRLKVDDVALFKVEGGFDYNEPGLPKNGVESRLSDVGLLGGDPDA